MIKIPFFTLLLIGSLTIQAQTPAVINMDNGNDSYSKIEKNQVEALYELYAVKIGPVYQLMNGREHNSYYRSSNFKPILFINKTHSSEIAVRGINYKDIPLNYDTYKDIVLYGPVLSMVNSSSQVELNNDDIDGFKLSFNDDNMSFRYLGKNENPGFNLNDGFYEVVYDGKSKYLIKHKSIEYINNSILEYKYTPIGYINTGNGYIKIRTRRQFIKQFGDRSHEIEKFMSKSGINFRTADKRQIAGVLMFYDSIRPENK